MVWWRFKGDREWRFGYCTYVSGPGTIRLGKHAGDSVGGSVVEAFDIEWKEYRR
jgi:hypothetical protein